MAKAPKNDNIIKGITPAGIAVYPRLNEPDTKFDPNGTYSVRLKLTDEEAAPLIDIIDKLIDEAFEEAVEEAKTPAAKKKIKRADVPYKAEEDDQGEPTGYTLFNFKRKASGVTKEGKAWAYTCPVFDAKLKPVDLTKVQIGGGSTIVVSYSAVPFNVPALGVGASLRLEAVQLLDLKEWGAKDASSFGFGVSDGFEAEEVSTEAQVFSGEGDVDESGDF